MTVEANPHPTKQADRAFPVPNARHSPGPFEAGASRACEIEILDARGCEVARVGTPLALDRHADPCDTQDANVRLLLAAPDLLAACRAAMQLLDGVAAEEERNGKRNAAMNVRAVEMWLARAIAKASDLECVQLGGGPYPLCQCYVCNAARQPKAVTA